MDNRYLRNIGTYTQEEFEKIQSSHVCVCGCGGLGGYALEMLARLGVGSITGIDYDVVSETNLNRQIIAYETNMGKVKIHQFAERLKIVNSSVSFKPVSYRIDKQNARELLAGHDIIIDSLDNAETRLILEETCEVLGIPLVHGAVTGMCGQAASIFPGDRLLKKIYDSSKKPGVISVPSFTPALIASVQVSEAVKILLGRPDVLRNALLTIDLLNNSYEIIHL